MDENFLSDKQIIKKIALLDKCKCALCQSQKSKYEAMLNKYVFDPDTIQGDYAEAFHHISRTWKQSEIDNRFYKEDGENE